jgi:hypothetical protein
MNPFHKLTSRQRNQEAQQPLQRQQQQQETGLEFGSVEAMLRHDALNTPVPPSVGLRLRESASQLPMPSRAWWRRWFGK